MSGTRVGGLKAAQSNKTKFGEDFYKVIGAAGGKKGHTGGFYANRELARVAGIKGGKVSKRRPTTKWEEFAAEEPKLESRWRRWLNR